MSISLQTPAPKPILKKGRCFRPVCGYPRLTGECPDMKCAEPHLRTLDLGELTRVQKTTTQTTITKANQKLLAENRAKFGPDFRFWLGAGLMAFGMYTLLISKKKSR